jgi:hypothetical protein
MTTILYLANNARSWLSTKRRSVAAVPVVVPRPRAAPSPSPSSPIAVAVTVASPQAPSFANRVRDRFVVPPVAVNVRQR